MLPGPIVLADPLPDGWRRPDPAPWRDPAEVPVTVERLAPVAEATDWPVTSSPGIMGGAPCIAGTRVPVSALVEMRRDGWSAGQIQRDGYPHVPLSTIRAALAWADAHPEAVPPRPVAPAGRWVRRCRTHACGLADGHAGAHETLREPPCTCSRYDGDTRCNACEGLVWQAAAVAVAGPEVDVGAELRGDAPTLADVAAVIDRAQRSLDAVPMPCAETMLAIDALESAETLVADLRAAYMAPEHAPVTRAERIEAAARALVCAGDAMVAAQGRFDGIGAERARAECVAAHGRLRAALCSCTGHGPDLACVEHGEALRAWQKRHAP